MKKIERCLHLSQIFGLTQSGPGIIMVEFLFSIVGQLLDASMDDDGLLELTPEKKSRWENLYQEMELDVHESYNNKKTEHQEKLQNLNTLMAIDIIGQFLQDKKNSRILYLVRQNMYVLVLLHCIYSKIILKNAPGYEFDRI